MKKFLLFALLSGSLQAMRTRSIDHVGKKEYRKVLAQMNLGRDIYLNFVKQQDKDILAINNPFFDQNKLATKNIANSGRHFFILCPQFTSNHGQYALQQTTKPILKALDPVAIANPTQMIELETPFILQDFVETPNTTSFFDTVFSRPIGILSEIKDATSINQPSDHTTVVQSQTFTQNYGPFVNATTLSLN